MKSLDESRARLELLLPGLDAQLSSIPLLKLEAPESEGIRLYREAGGAGLLVPTVHGGLGATAADSYHVARAIGTRSPSLALAVTMHNFSIASLLPVVEHSDGPEWMLLDAIANDNLLVASGFAEGKPTQDIFDPGMSASQEGNGWRINGQKRPCSLSRSMDLMAASVRLQYSDSTWALGVAVVPAESDGLSVLPSWGGLVLNGAESDTVVLEDVLVPSEFVFEIEDGDVKYDDIQDLGLAWFTLWMSSAYLGTVSALVERALNSGRGTITDRVKLVGLVEGAGLALQSVAAMLDAPGDSKAPLAPSLVARQVVAESIASVVPLALDLLGGMAFASEQEVGYLATCAYGVRMHPPGRSRREPALADWYLTDA